MPLPQLEFWAYKLFFQDQRGVGWSEVYTRDAPNPVDPDLATQLDGLISVRLDMLNINSKIIYASVSDIAVPGDVTVLDTNAPHTGTANGDAMPASDAIHVRQQANEAQWITRLYRGISLSDLAFGDEIEPTGPFTAAYPAMSSFLALKNFGVLHLHATARFAQFSFQPYLDGFVLRRISHRDAGRPFGQRVGRR